MRRKPLQGHRSTAEGITLVEAMVTLAILGILASVAAPSFKDLLLNLKLAGAAADFHSKVSWARTQAVQSGRPVTVQVSKLQNGSCYAIFTGSPGECGCAATATSCALPSTQWLLETLPAGSGLAVDTSSATGHMTFDPVRGTNSPTMTTIFTASNGTSIRHITNLMGRTRTCSPSNTGGLPAC